MGGMRIAVLSDIHSNIEALDAVLASEHARAVDATFVLGDLVGYNADPDAVVERLLALPNATLLAGNHDLAATGRFDASWFNHAAEAAIRWTSGVIAESTRALLGELQPSAENAVAMLVHGSVRDPAVEYVTNTDVARQSFDAADFGVCFFGHTHLPTAFVERDGVEGVVLADGQPVVVPEGARAMLNPGSVGQPRDGDPRASFLVYDDAARTAVVHRVAYDIERTQTKIRAAGLPPALAERLGVGR
jgi:predicted phosphodiesterase